MNLYEFMSGSPFLTFFLFLIAGEVIVKIVFGIVSIFTKQGEADDRE